MARCAGVCGASNPGARGGGHGRAALSPGAERPAFAALQGRGRSLFLSHFPSFPCSEQLGSRAANGSAALTQAAVEFPLLVSLASGSFTFCKVASLLPGLD